MSTYLVTQVRTINVEAPSAAVARAIAVKAFARELSPADIPAGTSVSNVNEISCRTEKVR